MKLTTTVIVVTLNRPDYVRRCLECLVVQRPEPHEIIVVDASQDQQTLQVVGEFPDVIYLRNDNGYGRMTASRNIGLKIASGDIIAFVDDDAFVHPGWLANLLQPYADASVGAVGGQVRNGQADEEKLGADRVGTLTRWGELNGFFAADPGRLIDVDHVMGCNMSFRRSVLAQLGGFREDYPGISGVREDSDMCLRVRQAGFRIVFSPAARVDHAAAPQAHGRRFDQRYIYFLQRNHVCLLIRNYGPCAGIVWRYLAYSAWQPLTCFFKTVASAMARLLVSVVATMTGVIAGVWLITRSGRHAARRDAGGCEIRELLSDLPTAPRAAALEERCAATPTN